MRSHHQLNGPSLYCNRSLSLSIQFHSIHYECICMAHGFPSNDVADDDDDNLCIWGGFPYQHLEYNNKKEREERNKEHRHHRLKDSNLRPQKRLSRSVWSCFEVISHLFFSSLSLLPAQHDVDDDTSTSLRASLFFYKRFGSRKWAWLGPQPATETSNNSWLDFSSLVHPPSILFFYRVSFTGM